MMNNFLKVNIYKMLEDREGFVSTSSSRVVVVFTPYFPHYSISGNI